MGTKLSSEAKRPTRKGRPNHSVEFKRHLAKQACEAGVSVSRLAQEHGVNANLLFKWRRLYRAGLFDVAPLTSALLPVSVMPGSAVRPQTEPLLPGSGQVADAGIEIAFSDCTLRIGSATNLKMLRAVLVLLRQ